MTQTTTPHEAVLKAGWLKRDTAKAAARVAEWSTNKEPAMNVHEYVDGYEFRGDQDYTPNDDEKVLIEDAIHGYLAMIAPAPASGGVEAVAELLAGLSAFDHSMACHVGIGYFDGTEITQEWDQLVRPAMERLKTASFSPAATPVSEAGGGPTYVVNCCNCGRIVDTREKDVGGDGFGAELADEERWVCSPECWDAVVDPDLAKPASPAGGDVRETLETCLSEMLEARDRLLCYHARTDGLDHGIDEARRALSALSQSTAGEAVDPSPAPAPAPSAWPKDPETGLNDLSLTTMLRGAREDGLREALEKIAAWLEQQRKEVPAHGWEFAAALRAIGPDFAASNKDTGHG